MNRSAKTGIQVTLSAKPEVEIWRRPFFSTQRPRLSIRLQTHYGVYHLEPLQSYLPGVLTLRDCDGRKTWQKYLKSERCFAITGITGDTATIRAKIRHKQSSRVR